MSTKLLKMRAVAIVVLIVGVACVLAEPISIPTDTNVLPISEVTGLEKVITETDEQNEVIDKMDLPIKDVLRESNIDIIIEENLEEPPEEFNPLAPFEDDLTGDMFSANAPVYQSAVVPGEIMDTAEGFVPLPIFKRNKHNARRRVTNRRVFRKNPHRRMHFYYPYSYYRFYRPSYFRYY